MFIRVHPWSKNKQNTMKGELLYHDETYKIIGAAMEVLNTLGHGFYEKPYENALAVELKLRDIECQQQRKFPILYKGQFVGEFIPHIIALKKIVVDAKIVDSIGNSEKGQMLNYLKVTGYRLGLIINFKHPRLEHQRILL